MKINSILVLLSILAFNGLGVSQNNPNLSPYDCIYNHLFFLQDNNYDPLRAGKSFPLTIDSSVRKTLAIKLKQIYDGKGLFVKLEDISDDSNYFDSSRNESTYIIFENELPEIFLMKSSYGWVYSNESVNTITKLHKSVYPLGTDLLLNLLPKKSSKRVLGLYSWQYLGLGVFLVFCSLLFFLVRFGISLFLKHHRNWYRVNFLASIWLCLKLFGLLLPILLLPVKAMEVFNLVLAIATSILLLLVALSLANILLSYADRLTRKTESKMDEQLLPVLNRFVQFVVIAIWGLHLLTLLGVNITTLIAGISIGGLAIALAAQDTLKNLFGSLTIFLDKPFQIGDWVIADGMEGTVEEVGFRSTRIRSFANSLIYMPNSKLSDSTIDNLGLRRYRRYKTVIGLTYNTPTGKIDAFVKGLRKLVEDHPNTRKDSNEIYLNNLGDSAIEILFYIFFEVDSWTDELSSKHDLIMSILKLAEEIGVSFAFPSTSIYMEKNSIE